MQSALKPDQPNKPKQACFGVSDPKGMKTLLQLVLFAVLPFLIAGCEMKQNPKGIQVNIRSESFETLKAELRPFLDSKGFKIVNDAGRKNWPFLILFSPHTKIAALTAYFSFPSEGAGFVIGKINSTPDYTDGEIAIMDECATLLTAHAALIISGSVLNGSTSPLARDAFYAKIKKS